MNLWFINKNSKFNFTYEDPNIEENTKSFSADVKLKGIGYLKIVKYRIDNIQEDVLNLSKYPKINSNIVSLCKSNLQKCVRRGEEDKAIRTALALYIYNPDELLRRLPVIMIEDALPHPESFIKCIWWMCASSKGYKLSRSELEELLGIVSTMCESTHYVIFNGDMKIDPIDKELWKTLSSQRTDFTCALEIRKMYGGLKGDVQMLNYHQKLWNESNYWTILTDQPVYIIDLNSVDKFDKDDILLCSIDFHPYPFILDKITENTEYDQQIIKSVIWMCSSRINIRTPINSEKYVNVSTKMSEQYKNIEKSFKGIATWLLNKIQIY
jgi:hypothetical protein